MTEEKETIHVQIIQPKVLGLLHLSWLFVFNGDRRWCKILSTLQINTSASFSIIFFQENDHSILGSIFEYNQSFTFPHYKHKARDTIFPIHITDDIIKPNC